MALVKLSKRMERLAQAVTVGKRLADVGTDHAYIPIALTQRGRIPSAIALDVNRGPLSRAQEHIHAYGLDTYIETRLSDGLLNLESGEADSVLIAGMGGVLTARILEGGGRCLDTAQELILQPQSQIRLVRKWLTENGFWILEEDIVREEGKYYPLLRAIHGEQRLDDAELSYGKATLQRSPLLLSEYMRGKRKKNCEVMELLKKRGKGGSARAEELQSDNDAIHCMLKRMKEE